jgi:opacity protein-like surface antigen
MKSYIPIRSATLIVLCAGVSLAQAQSSMSYKEDIGVDLLYQGSHHLTFDGGSQVNLKDDLGFALTYTYRFTPNFDLQMGMDFQWLSDPARRRHLQLPARTFHALRERRPRLELDRYGYSKLAALSRLLVGSLVWLLLRRLSKYAQHQ